ncbi:class I SAM-dependent methyltransferase [Saliphagus sp. GCM10025308]
MPEQTEIQDEWTEIAPGYDEYVTPSNMAIAEEALERSGLQPGMQVLDVAAGSGALSIPAARAGAQVLATDISPAMVEHLEARARDEGLSTLEVRVMDGHALELEDDTFDVAGSQFGVMLFPDLPQGLGEMTRVTRPGGRVLLVTMGPPAEIEFLEFFLGAVKATVPDFAAFRQTRRRYRSRWRIPRSCTGNWPTPVSRKFAWRRRIISWRFTPARSCGTG